MLTDLPNTVLRPTLPCSSTAPHPTLLHTTPPHTSTARPICSWPGLGYEWEQAQLWPISILSSIQAQQMQLVSDHSLSKVCMCSIHLSKQTLAVSASTIHPPPTPHGPVSHSSA